MEERIGKIKERNTGREMSDKDRLEVASMRERKTELLQMLGMTGQEACPTWP